MAKFHIELPYVKVSKSASQSIPNAAASPYTTVTWDTLESTDPYSMFNNANDCLVAPINGVYVFTSAFSWDGDPVGVRVAQPQLSTTGPAGAYTLSYRTQYNGNAAGVTSNHLHSHLRVLSAGDCVRVSAYQNSGAPLNLLTSANTFMELRMVGRV